MRLSTPSTLYTFVTRSRALSTTTRIPSRPLSTSLHRNATPTRPTVQRLHLPLITTRLSSSTKPGVKSGDHAPIDTRPLTDRSPNAATDAQYEEQNRLRREQEPAYQIVFTCKPCGHRSAHRMSKHGYHRGTVVIRCPSCSNRHVMSDHLKIFLDQSSTLEDILKESGGKITRGYLEGDMEFWEDGSVTKSGGSEPASAGGEQGEAKREEDTKRLK